MKLCGTTAMTVALVLMQFTVAAFAHTKLTEAKPGSESVLEQSPLVIELTFEHAVNLTSAVLVVPGKAERTLVFKPVGSATSFRIEDPRLGPGRNEIRWKALSGDGHVVTGTLVYEIRAAAAKPR